MKDLLQNFVIVSIDCVGMWVYSKLYPNLNRAFIPYNTPLIGHMFRSDWDFLKFCENYDDFVEKTPTVIKASDEPDWKDVRAYSHADLERPILMIHEESPDAAMQEKWIGRTKLGRGLEKIFIWSGGSFISPRDGDERGDIMKRWNNLPGYTIFITERVGEVYDDGKHFVVECADWFGQTQNNRAGPPWHQLNWHQTGLEGGRTVPMFKQIIEERILILKEENENDVPTNQAVNL